MNRFTRLRKEVRSLVDDYKLTRQQKKSAKDSRDALLAEMKHTQEALVFIQQVGVVSQEEIIGGIEKLVTYAIRDVFVDEGYDFVIQLDDKKSTMSLDFLFERDGEFFNPLVCCEYGVVDVVCFALRLAIWGLLRCDRVLVLDEPFKNISAEYIDRACAFVHTISKKLEFQFIIITHIPEFKNHCDNLVRIKK
jgi:hypothetical protein